MSAMLFAHNRTAVLSPDSDQADIRNPLPFYDTGASIICLLLHAMEAGGLIR